MPKEKTKILSPIEMDTLCLKITEKVSFAEFLKSWSLASNSVTRQVNFNWWKMPNFKNSNETFLDDFQTMWDIICDVQK